MPGDEHRPQGRDTALKESSLPVGLRTVRLDYDPLRGRFASMLRARQALREKNHVSQPVFARYLNTSQSTVQKWETGAKRPSGPALKLLALVQKHGLQMLA